MLNNRKYFSLLLCLAVLCACDTGPKKELFLGKDNTLYVVEAGDDIDFLVLDSSSSGIDSSSQDIRLDEAHVQWLPDQNIEDIPPALTEQSYLHESWEHAVTGLPKGRLIYQDPNGDVLLLGIKSNSGKNYWIKNSSNNIYGSKILSRALLNDEENIDTENLTLEVCELSSCRAAGSISWTASYDFKDTIDTPYAIIETIRVTRLMNISINNTDESYEVSLNEVLWVYPAIGVVQRNYLGQYAPDNNFPTSFEVHFAISNTSIQLNNESLAEQ